MTEKKENEKTKTNSGFYFDEVDIMKEMNAFKQTQQMLDILPNEKEKEKVLEEIKKITDQWEECLNPLIKKLNESAEYRAAFVDQLKQKYGKN